MFKKRREDCQDSLIDEEKIKEIKKKMQQERKAMEGF